MNIQLSTEHAEDCIDAMVQAYLENNQNIDFSKIDNLTLKRKLDLIYEDHLPYGVCKADFSGLGKNLQHLVEATDLPDMSELGHDDFFCWRCEEWESIEESKEFNEVPNSEGSIYNQLANSLMRDFGAFYLIYKSNGLDDTEVQTAFKVLIDPIKYHLGGKYSIELSIDYWLSDEQNLQASLEKVQEILDSHSQLARFTHIEFAETVGYFTLIDPNIAKVGIDKATNYLNVPTPS